MSYTGSGTHILNQHLQDALTQGKYPREITTSLAHLNKNELPPYNVLSLPTTDWYLQILKMIPASKGINILNELSDQEVLYISTRHPYSYTMFIKTLVSGKIHIASPLLITKM